MLPKVTVTADAVGPGSFPAIEGVALFIGTVEANGANSKNGALNPIGRDSDLVALFGVADNLADVIGQARSNGGPNWQAWAIGHINHAVTVDAAAAVDKTGGKVGIPVTGHKLPAGVQVTLAGTVNYNGAHTVDVDTTANEIVIVATYIAEVFTGAETATVAEDWEDVIDAALIGCEPELIVICKPIAAGSELTTMNTRATTLLNSERRVIFLAAFRGINAATETWSAYLTAAQAITAGLALRRVAIVPALYGGELGAAAGRMAAFGFEGKTSRSLARVRSGSVVNPGSAPVDSAGVTLDKATLEALNTDRFTVFTFYNGREGIYFGRGNTLEASGGKFPFLEWLRVIDKGARRVYIVGVDAVGDDEVENTPAGNAAFGTRAASPLRQMAAPAVREIKPLAKDAISVAWPSASQVKVAFKVRPLDAPHDIEEAIILDKTT